MYTVIYSEQKFDGKPAKRFTIPNLTIEKVHKVIGVLKEPIPGLLVKWLVYNEKNEIIIVGESRSPQ